MEPNNSDYFYVYNMRYAASLMLQGFRPMITRNIKDKRFYVFKFRNTEAFQKAFSDLTK
ncbi:DUF5659 domain-containing protein [Acetivibrio cellulolyticus]|uniref:DUF5659 domain-containing protein n=1 Tax=Acetivibrio cellulolyticus TaxID=35830 RepID=UPI0001E2BDC8